MREKDKRTRKAATQKQKTIQYLSDKIKEANIHGFSWLTHRGMRLKIVPADLWDREECPHKKWPEAPGHFYNNYHTAFLRCNRRKIYLCEVICKDGARPMYGFRKTGNLWDARLAVVVEKHGDDSRVETV